MAFKKSLFALVLALPLGLGLTIQPSATQTSCNFLVPIGIDLIENLFQFQCGDAAHGALRLLFHDAIGIDPILGGGGADGSIITFNSTELAFPANDGLDDVLANVGPFFLKYKDVISPGDFIQFAGVLGLTFCPGAPRVRFAFGRPQPTAASPPDLVPEPFDDVTKILARFASVGFSPKEVVAVLSSHSIAGADTVDPAIPGTPFDSTPSVFDTSIFTEVLLKGFTLPGKSINPGELQSAVQGTMRLQSDALIARDSRTACFWQSLATNQPSMASQFAAGVFKLSLLGQNPAHLTDCSFLIPPPLSLKDVSSFPPQQFIADVEQSCAGTPFPNLPTQPGPALVVPAIPQAHLNGTSGSSS